VVDELRAASKMNCVDDGLLRQSGEVAHPQRVVSTSAAVALRRRDDLSHVIPHNVPGSSCFGDKDTKPVSKRGAKDEEHSGTNLDLHIATAPNKCHRGTSRRGCAAPPGHGNQIGWAWPLHEAPIGSSCGR